MLPSARLLQRRSSNQRQAALQSQEGCRLARELARKHGHAALVRDKHITIANLHTCSQQGGKCHTLARGCRGSGGKLDKKEQTACPSSVAKGLLPQNSEALQEMEAVSKAQLALVQAFMNGEQPSEEDHMFSNHPPGVVSQKKFKAKQLAFARTLLQAGSPVCGKDVFTVSQPKLWPDFAKPAPEQCMMSPFGRGQLNLLIVLFFMRIILYALMVAVFHVATQCVEGQVFQS